MTTVYDGDLEVGRFDLVHARTDVKDPVDVNLVLHVCSTDDEKFARKLLADTVAMYAPATPHVRLVVYVAEFNSVLVFVTDPGMRRWCAQLTGEPLHEKAARDHYATDALNAYKACMREYASQPFCTHEVSFADGGAIYYAGE